MTWQVYTCEILGKPAIVLIDDQFVDRLPFSEIPLLSWFGVYCNLPPDGACWAEEEAVALDQVEDRLIELVQQFGRGWAVYLMRLATPGIREYYVYHSPKVEMGKAFAALKASAPTYRIEHEISEDGNWAQYRKFVSFR